MDAAERAVSGIERDLTERRGLRQAWGQVDQETQQEIRDKWGRIIREAMKIAAPDACPAPPSQHEKAAPSTLDAMRNAARWMAEIGRHMDPADMPELAALRNAIAEEERRATPPAPSAPAEEPER